MKKVLLGMSGGVDSSVAAILLKKQGYNVIGLTMNLHEKNDANFGNDAKELCKKLGIEHYTCDYTKEFDEKVISNFVCQYKNCKTPNPCIECNKYLKFGAMYEMAKKLGCDYIATGHYAITEYDEKYKKVVLKKSKSLKKDQSYVLYNINPEVVEKTIFPLGKYESKEEIRDIARKNGFEVANKPDSEDICFIPDNNYVRFLEEEKNFISKQGNIVNLDGKILGKHSGLYKHTIGQRKGLGISNPVPLYVIGYNVEKNELIVGEEDKLYSNEVILENFNNLLGIEIDGLKIKAKIRYSSKEASAVIHKELINGKEQIKIIFDERQRAITPGQSLVAYIDDVVVGGGIISNL